MAIFASSIITSPNGAIESIRDFAEANGYTIDLYEPGRLHIHKHSNEYFGFVVSSSSNMDTYGHTGFDASLGTHAQPGTSGRLVGSMTAGSTLELYATPNAIYMGRVDTHSGRAVGGVGRMVDKFGSWTGGQFVSPLHSTYGRILWTISSSNFFSSLRRNGSWTPTGSGTGALVSSDDDPTFCTRMPFSYSAGVAPSRILVTVRSSNQNLFTPIGYAPDVYKIRFGDVYSAGERISIGNEVYQVAGVLNTYAFKVP